MRNTLRLLSAALLVGTGLTAAAQGHTIFVAGHMTPCNPANAGGVVNVHVYGINSGPVAVSTTMNENCYYYIEMLVPDTAGIVFVGASCANGTFTQDSAMYSLTPPFTTDVIVDLNCGGGVLPCEACYTVEQNAPFSGIFSSCTSGGSGEFSYVWDFSGPGGGGVPGNNITHVFPGPGSYTACLNVTDANGSFCQMCDSVVVDADGNINPAPTTEPCEAGYWVIQAYDSLGGDVQPIPNELWIWNLSSGGVQPFTFVWNFGDGSTSTEAYPTHVYPTGGPYELCLTMTDSEGCTSTYCDEVSVDEDGLINGMVVEPGSHTGANASRSGFTINVINHAVGTGVADLTLDHLVIAPNPVQEHLNIALDSRLQGTADVAILDVDGRVVMTHRQAMAKGGNRFSLDTNSLTEGLYLVRIVQNGQTLVHRFVRTH
ncbi:MAG TPA: PKD domain-containing protein [Flavobacteriales bacterium]